MLLKNVITQICFLGLFLWSCGSEQKSKSKESPPDSSPPAASAQKSKKLPKMDTAKVDVSSLPPVTSLSFEGLYQNEKDLIEKAFQFLTEGDTLGLKSVLLSYAEYKGVYYHLNDADLNPNSSAFMATMFHQGNRKNLPRWMRYAKENPCTYDGYDFSGQEEKHNGFTLLSGYKIYCKEASGKRGELPFFRTLFKVEGGYKLWSILET